MCVAYPGQIIATEGEGHTRSGTLEYGSRRLSVSLALVSDAQVGDWVIAHSGLAIRVLPPGEAAQTLATLGFEGAEP